MSLANGSLTFSIPISKVWVSKRSFNETLWLPAYFKLEDQTLWQAVDLSSISGEKKLQVQTLHNNTHQDPLWKHQMIPKTCINLLFCVGSAWSFEFSAHLLNVKQIQTEFEFSRQRGLLRKAKNKEEISPLEFDDNDLENADELDDEEESRIKAQIDENNRKGNEITVSLSTDIPKLLRISNKKKTWGIVIECLSPNDVTLFTTWWKQFEDTFWSNSMNQDLSALSAKLPSNRYAEAIKEFYKTADPNKSMEDINKVLVKYDSKLIVLMNMLWHKYGSHPIAAMKEILMREEAPQLELRAQRRKEKMLQIKAERAARKEQERAKKQEEERHFMELLKEFCQHVPTSSSDNASKKNKQQQKKGNSSNEEQEIEESLFNMAEYNVIDETVSSTTSSKKRTASKSVANGVLTDQSNFQLIQINSTNVPGFERFEVDYYVKRKTSFAVSLPLLPNALLVHVSARNWKSASASTDEITSWCHFELNRFDDNRYYTGTLNKGRSAKDDVVFDIDVEWNCPWFDESKITLPSCLLSISSKRSCELAVNLPAELPHVPLEIHWDYRFDDWEVDVPIPSKLRQLEIFLFYAHRLLTDGEVKLPDENENYDEEEVFPRIDFVKGLEPLSTLHAYPDIVFNDAKDGFFKHWFDINILGQLNK